MRFKERKITMGLIKAITGAAGGTLADQWKEFIYCDTLSEDVLIKTVSVILPTKEILPAVEMGVIKMQVKIPIQATRMTLHD